MPATRNDITHKPIMTDTTRKDRWVAYTPMGKAIVIYANSEEEAQQHALEQGWQFTTGDTS
jgi:hypothetical protein